MFHSNSKVGSACSIYESVYMCVLVYHMKYYRIKWGSMYCQAVLFKTPCHHIKSLCLFYLFVMLRTCQMMTRSVSSVILSHAWSTGKYGGSYILDIGSLDYTGANLPWQTSSHGLVPLLMWAVFEHNIYCLGVGCTCTLSVARTNQRTWLRIFIVYSDYLLTLSLAWMRETPTNIFPMWVYLYYHNTDSYVMYMGGLHIVVSAWRH